MSEVKDSPGQVDPIPTELREGRHRTDVLATPTGRRSKKFRPDVQALRAIAVSSVVLYHFWPNWVRGGFVGVDVFFVISGFLITTHLLAELDRTGRIRLRDFWARRIRRLLPAAFTVLAATLLAMRFLMSGVVWQHSLSEIGASAGYFENWLLAKNSVDYLASADAPSLAQHYWSLSVEEQFYLVWPLLLLVVALIARRWWPSHQRRVLRTALALVAVLSFASSVIATAKWPSIAFFATPVRAWEFAVGGLIATSPGIASLTRHPRVGLVLTWIGLAILAAAVFGINGATVSFPGWIAAIPVAGCALVLLGGMRPVGGITAAIAEWSPVQWLGDYSYSIYLWHWPIIIGLPYMIGREPSFLIKLVGLAAALVLAFLTKRFVEDPVRTGHWWRARMWPSYAFAAVGMAAILVITTSWNGQLTTRHKAEQAAGLAEVQAGTTCFGADAMMQGGCVNRFDRPADFDASFAGADLQTQLDLCQSSINSTQLILCDYGDVTDPTSVVYVVGNSHALRLIPALDLYGKQHRWKIVLAAKTNCQGLVSTWTGPNGPSPSCLGWTTKLQRTVLATPSVSAVLFASHNDAQVFLAGDNATTAEIDQAKSSMVGVWSTLKARGIHSLVTEDIPGTRPDDAPTCVALAPSPVDPCAKPRSEMVQTNLMTEAAQQNPGLVSYLPLSQYFCDATTCHAMIGGVVVYSDSHHISITYSRSMAPFFGRQVSAALAG